MNPPATRPVSAKNITGVRLSGPASPLPAPASPLSALAAPPTVSPRTIATAALSAHAPVNAPNMIDARHDFRHPAINRRG
jgi:hypothetical protein